MSIWCQIVLKQSRQKWQHLDILKIQENGLFFRPSSSLSSLFIGTSFRKCNRKRRKPSIVGKEVLNHERVSNSDSISSVSGGQPSIKKATAKENMRSAKLNGTGEIKGVDAKWYGQTGIYKTGLFWHPSIIVCSPELFKKVLTDDDRFTVAYSSGMLKLLGRKALHGVSESEHKLLRRLMTAPINGHEALSMHISYIEDIVISSLEEWANMNSPIEFLNELKKISFSVITKIFTGSTDFLSMIKYFTDVFKGLYALPINFPGFTFHRALKARKILVNIIKAHMDEKRCRKTDEPNTKRRMINLLWEVNDDDGEKLEDEHIVNLLHDFLLAGHHPTAVAAMQLTIYLHDHPEMLRRAKEEQMEIIKRRPSSQKGLTLNELRQMEYLSKAIDETMRLSNTTFSASRKAKVDVEINGYIIPKGWNIFIWSGAVHFNSENYSSPKEFLPSRWDNHKPKFGTFIPFGAGSRTCPGADLNKILVSIFLHYFLLNYRLERINPSPTPVDNCLAKITKLNPYDHA
ncbi:hypothetical protein REPUB_Repub08aG0220000 [Reevesia pubescens]